MNCIDCSRWVYSGMRCCRCRLKRTKRRAMRYRRQATEQKRIIDSLGDKLQTVAIHLGNLAEKQKQN